ncbi:poly(ADP-ribose) glycohydrolase [Lecanosticta acicola]|uniref:Poly(ADP-ribose) glycohydrolase n=1 Tax=Lecanosticta acicola TaxID=111012 RepID=A0AAI8YVG8_9PEZI|nr:poly(ADP-ribose) glycohydrolase [Lecanosticta acicola]
MSTYCLPNHSSLTSQDPLGICSSDGASVSHWSLLRQLLQTAGRDLEHIEQSTEDTHSPQRIDSAWLRRLATLFQDIAYSLHGDGNLNTDGLHSMPTRIENPRQWCSRFRTTLFKSALQLENLFPDGNLDELSSGNPTAVFSPAQMDCLLAHMLLGTLQIPKGNTWGRPGFTQYFDGKIAPVVPNTALPYLETILFHFAQGGYPSPNKNPNPPIKFRYSDASHIPSVSTSRSPAPEIPTTIVSIPLDPSAKPTTTTTTTTPAPFVLVAANAQPGPGAGGTHEERLVGQSPALALAALLTPVLPATAALITSPLPVHASWQGHGREARLVSHLSPARRPARRYIVADALPLDLSHKQPHLLESNVEREVGKLYAAFRGAKHAWLDEGLLLEDLRVEMPPWGCGAFGGSLQVKMPCMMMAAGLAGLRSGNLELLVPESQKDIIWNRGERDITVQKLYGELTGSGTFLSSLRKLLIGKG